MYMYIAMHLKGSSESCVPGIWITCSYHRRCAWLLWCMASNINTFLTFHLIEVPSFHRYVCLTVTCISIHVCVHVIIHVQVHVDYVECQSKCPLALRSSTNMKLLTFTWLFIYSKCKAGRREIQRNIFKHHTLQDLISAGMSWHSCTCLSCCMSFSTCKEEVETKALWVSRHKVYSFIEYVWIQWPQRLCNCCHKKRLGLYLMHILAACF